MRHREAREHPQEAACVLAAALRGDADSVDAQAGFWLIADGLRDLAVLRKAMS